MYIKILTELFFKFYCKLPILLIKSTSGKDLRSAVTLMSPHWIFWSNALDILRSMKYGPTKKIPSIANWININRILSKGEKKYIEPN